MTGARTGARARASPKRRSSFDLATGDATRDSPFRTDEGSISSRTCRSHNPFEPQYVRGKLRGRAVLRNRAFVCRPTMVRDRCQPGFGFGLFSGVALRRRCPGDRPVRCDYDGPRSGGAERLSVMTRLRGAGRPLRARLIALAGPQLAAELTQRRRAATAPRERHSRCTYQGGCPVSHHGREATAPLCAVDPAGFARGREVGVVSRQPLLGFLARELRRPPVQSCLERAQL